MNAKSLRFGRQVEVGTSLQAAAVTDSEVDSHTLEGGRQMEQRDVTPRTSKASLKNERNDMPRASWTWAETEVFHIKTSNC